LNKQAPPIDKTAIACGILAAVMGLFIVLSAIGIIPSRMAAGVERWIGSSREWHLSLADLQLLFKLA
jgi:hypothetical protein